jgi:hypothetical protein
MTGSPVFKEFLIQGNKAAPGDSDKGHICLDGCFKVGFPKMLFE